MIYSCNDEFIEKMIYSDKSYDDVKCNHANL